jgi:hypothetical protein
LREGIPASAPPGGLKKNVSKIDPARGRAARLAEHAPTEAFSKSVSRHFFEGARKLLRLSLLRETRTVPESHVQAKGQARQV